MECRGFARYQCSNSSAAWKSQMSGMYGVGQMDSVHQDSVVKLAEPFRTFHLGVGVHVMLKVQFTDRVVPT